MVVCDMDGTLLNSDLKISLENLQAIKGLREKGIRFCIATGRPEQLLKEYVDPLKMEDPIIMYNGSVIGHPFKDEKLYELCLKKDDIRDIIGYCERNGILNMIYTKDKIISKPNWRVDFFKERNKKLQIRNQSIFTNLYNIDKTINENKINKILLIEKDKDKYQTIIEKLKHFKDIKVVASQKGFIDINPVGSSKGKAVQILAKHFGYDLSEIVIFGDQDNDVSMLEIAGVSVAMANGSENAKSISDFITDSNDDNGFANWVNKSLLK
jgi:Cof subfamily protein (haloacid dehalogenase superfamily)